MISSNISRCEVCVQFELYQRFFMSSPSTFHFLTILGSLRCYRRTVLCTFLILPATHVDLIGPPCPCSSLSSLDSNSQRYTLHAPCEIRSHVAAAAPLFLPHITGSVMFSRLFCSRAICHKCCRRAIESPVRSAELDCRYKTCRL